jgi:hypothetical protein
MYSGWNQDPVHGEKVAYTRIGLGIQDLIRKDSPMEQRDSLCPRKRGSKDDLSPACSRAGEEDRSRGYIHERIGYRRASLPPPTGLATQPTLSILATSTAGGAAPRTAGPLLLAV